MEGCVFERRLLTAKTGIRPEEVHLIQNRFSNGRFFLFLRETGTKGGVACTCWCEQVIRNGGVTPNHALVPVQCLRV